MRFKSSRRGTEAKLEPVEAAVLAQLAEETLALLGSADVAPEDPLAAMVGIATGDVQPPEDPALARLLPDAYADDPAAAQDFRRYTESDLRAGKRDAAAVVLAQLEPLRDGGRLVLDRDQADLWLRWLNDIRLVLGTRLEVSDDDQELDPEEPLAGIYGWLGWLQESLVACLVPRSLT